MKRKLMLVLSGVAAASLLVAACGGGGNTGGGGANKTASPASGGASKSASPAAAAATVNMVAGNRYEPPTITVKSGEGVRFVNGDSVIHDVKFQQGPSSPPVMNTGDTWTRTFDAAGNFPYICTYHEAEGMVGTVTVQ